MAAPHVSITNVEPNGNYGWEWTESIDGGSPTTYFTDSHGDGLWIKGSHEGKWAENYQDQQIEGTAQYSLDADTPEQAASILRSRARRANDI
jgi:hypothetical protein